MLTKRYILSALICLLGFIAPVFADIRSFSDDREPHRAEDRSEINFSIKISKISEQVLNRSHLEWDWYDLIGTKLASGKISLAGKKGQFNVPLKLQRREYGYYKLTLKVVDDRGIVHSEKTTTAARIRLADQKFAGRNTGYFGICGHNAADLTEVMSRIGVRFWRADFDWRLVEPQENKWDFRVTDAIANALSKNGITCLAILGYNPGWLKLEQNKPGDVEKYCRYVRKVVERYKGQIRHWDLWNEPQYTWNGDQILFAKIQKRAYETIKSVQPDAVICFNGHPFGEELRGYTREQLAAIGKNSMDVIGIHPYSRPLGPDDNDFLMHVRNIRSWLKQNHPATELWISELGWPTSTCNWGVSELQQASYMQRSMIYGLAGDCTRFCWYMVFSGPHKSKSEHQYGLINFSGRPKPSLLAFSHIAYMLRDAVFKKELEMGSDVRGFRFEQADGKSVFTIWATHDPVSFIWKRPKSKAVLTRMDGSSYQHNKADELLLSEVILFCETQDGDTWERSFEAGYAKLRHPVKISSSTFTKKGLLMQLENRDKLSRKVNAVITLPGDCEFSSPKLKGKNPAKISFQLGSLPKDILLNLNLKHNKVIDDKILVKLSGGNFKTDFSIPVRIFPGKYLSEYTIDAKSGKWKTPAPIILESYTNIGPVDFQRLWGGPNDLSAQAWYGWNERGIILYIEAKDNSHIPLPRTGKASSSFNMWRYDSVQLAINATPGFPPAFYDQNTAEIGVTIRDDRAYIHYFCGKSQPPVKAAGRRDDKKGVTYYDIFIPWQSIGLKHAPEKNSFVAVNFIVNDADGSENSARKYVEVSEGIAVVKSPNLYPLLRLEKRAE